MHRAMKDNAATWPLYAEIYMQIRLESLKV